MNNCDCTANCGDDPDLKKGLATPCHSRQPKTLLINGLQRQAALMQSNANYLEELYPELEHHHELRDAMLITKNWIKKLQEAA